MDRPGLSLVKIFANASPKTRFPLHCHGLLVPELSARRPMLHTRSKGLA